MISKLILASCGILAASTSDPAAVEAMLDSPLIAANDKWGIWKHSFSKMYGTTDAEDTAFDAFEANDRLIKEHNAKEGITFTLGHNVYSDLTWDEFATLYVSGMESNPNLRREKNVDPLMEGVEATADAVDWVTKGAVTPVKNQQQCGSCWAFSTTGSFEGAYQIATGNLVSFSEQMLVSCDNPSNGGTDQGCSGGLMDNAFKWIESKGGICTEDAYPYTSGSGQSGTCKTQCSPAATLGGFTDVASGDEKALLAAVEKNPVSVAIEADKSAFQLYKSGVFTSVAQCGTQLDHGVLAVGYGTDGANAYWKVKNSWGTSWGEEGYIRMIRDQDCCGIASQPSYPTGVKALAPAPTPTPGPTPTPTPTPGPTPTPTQDCLQINDETGCKATGTRCKWCVYSFGSFCSYGDVSCPTSGWQLFLSKMTQLVELI